MARALPLFTTPSSEHHTRSHKHDTNTGRTKDSRNTLNTDRTGTGKQGPNRKQSPSGQGNKPVRKKLLGCFFRRSEPIETNGRKAGPPGTGVFATGRQVPAQEIYRAGTGQGQGRASKGRRKEGRKEDGGHR